MQRPHTSGLDRRQFVTAASGAAIATAFGIRQSMASPSARYPVPNVLRGQDIGNLPTPRNQTIVVEETLNNIWDSFNPFIANGENGGYGLIQTCREALFYANFLTGEVRPWLATGYSYNADFSECTLKLNPAAAWSDGKPYTADDIVFSQTLLLENTTLNGSSDAQADLTAIKAADPHTVVFSLKQPSARFHYRFIAGISVDNLRVVPKHIWEGKDPGTFAFNPPVYTGPFQLQEASSSKLYYLWKKNPHYWNKANLDPKAEYVLYRQASSVDAAVQEFLAGNLDVAHQGWDSITSISRSSRRRPTRRHASISPIPAREASISIAIHPPVSSPSPRDGGQCRICSIGKRLARRSGSQRHVLPHSHGPTTSPGRNGPLRRS